MNSATICVQLLSAADGRFIKEGESKIAEAQVTFIHGYGDKEQQDQITLQAWNGLGDMLLSHKQSDVLLIIGRIDVNKVTTEEGNRNVFVLVASQIVPMPAFVKVNCLNVAGNVGQDPDVKYFESGSCKASSSLAVNRTKELTNWFNFETWGKTAETVANFVRKGSKVGLTGELTVEHWQDRASGNDRSKFNFKVDRVSLLARAADQQQSAATPDDEF